jgi:hypothetical protein
MTQSSVDPRSGFQVRRTFGRVPASRAQLKQRLKAKYRRSEARPLPRESGILGKAENSRTKVQRENIRVFQAFPKAPYVPNSSL